MPLPGYVDALSRALQPLDKDWFAYKLSEPRSQAAGGALAVGADRAWPGIRPTSR